jgi:glucokinase
MARSIGVLATHYLWVGIVEETSLGTVRMYPEPGAAIDLRSVPVEEMIARILEQIELLHEGEPVDSVGAGFPGIIRNGVIDDSPNLGP